MTESHKRPHRHPKYKTAYRVNNWREYDQLLRDRGDITLWISHDVLTAWRAPMTGKRGAQPVYSDIALETMLALRLLFHLPLRQTEGFLHAVLTLMGLALPCPDHTTLSRRNATVKVRRQVDRAPQGPISLIVDSSGLKVCGQGEWLPQKHGEKQGKRWKKLHLGVDDQGQIIAATVTESHEQDPSQVPELLSVDHVIDRFIGDGIYDQAPVYAAVARHSPGARVIVPPRKDAVLSSQVATSPTQRDGHILAIASNGRFPWKRTSGYYAQSHAENAFSRYKRIFGGRLRAKKDEAQEREASIACGLLNRMREWGRPHSYRVG
jgi:Transposase DDE domain